MRMKADRALVLAVLLVVVAVAVTSACGGGEPETETVTERETVTETETVTRTEAGDGRELAQECENAQARYSVRFPQGWHTNPGDVTPACSFFHPEEFELPEAQEVVGVALAISREPVRFGRVSGEDPATRVREREQIEVDGRRALRRVTEATGEALFPEGVRGYQYLVDLDGETLIASTYDVGELDFERNREVLDAMMQTLRIER